MTQRFHVRLVLYRIDDDRQPLAVDLEQEIEADSATEALTKLRRTVEPTLAALEAADRKLHG